MIYRLSLPEKISVALFVIFSVWWVVLYFVFSAELAQQDLYWAAVYQLLAWWGGIYGLISARMWGSFKSLMGRGIIFFSIGLLLQAFGQVTFSYYTTLLHIDIPYPSIADVGYFGSILFYVLGIASVAKISGVGVRLKETKAQLLALIVSLALLVFSYTLFLRGYEFDWSSPLKIFLDFGYPLGEALYVAIALLALILSRNILGGVMKTPLTFLITALIVQYFADFNFLYQAYNNTWINGGYGDFLYTLAYFLMAVSLAKIAQTLVTHRASESA